jgi:hypothetical protein
VLITADSDVDVCSFAPLCRRVDVTISSSEIAKVMRPTVLLEIHTSDARILTADTPLDVFQALRYQVAKALAELGQVDAHPALKIT